MLAVMLDGMRGLRFETEISIHAAAAIRLHSADVPQSIASGSLPSLHGWRYTNVGFTVRVIFM